MVYLKSLLICDNMSKVVPCTFPGSASQLFVPLLRRDTIHWGFFAFKKTAEFGGLLLTNRRAVWELGTSWSDSPLCTTPTLSSHVALYLNLPARLAIGLVGVASGVKQQFE